MKMSSSNILMFLLPVAVTPVLSRLYTQADFGEWGIFSSFVSILTIAIFAGYENTIVKATEEEISYVSTLCLLIAFIVTFFTALIFYIGQAEHISFFLNFPPITLLAVYLIAYAIHTVFSNICNRYGKYSGIAIENAILGGTQAGFRMLFGIVSLIAINGLILGTTLAQIATFVFLLFYIIHVGKVKKLWGWDINKMRSILFKYKNFALFDAPSSLLCFAGFNIPLLILVAFFDKETIGCYSIVLQLLLLPMSLVGSAIGRVYYEQLCSDKDGEQITNIQRSTLQVGKIVALISFIPMLFLACGGDKVVTLFLGSKWSTAGDISLCLAFWSFPTILTQPLIPLFRYLNKQKVLFLYNLAYSIVAVGTILLGCLVSRDIYFILSVYAFCGSMVNLAMYAHILRLGEISIKSFRMYIPLWILSSIILTIRLVLL